MVSPHRISFFCRSVFIKTKRGELRFPGPIILGCSSDCPVCRKRYRSVNLNFWSMLVVSKWNMLILKASVIIEDVESNSSNSSLSTNAFYYNYFHLSNPQFHRRQVSQFETYRSNDVDRSPSFECSCFKLRTKSFHSIYFCYVQLLSQVI